MQAAGFFFWNKNLKTGKSDIIKVRLKIKENLVLLFIGLLFSVAAAFILTNFGDKNPIFDSITTVFSILGMYLTV